MLPYNVSSQEMLTSIFTVDMSSIRGNNVFDTNAGHFNSVMASPINNTENLINKETVNILSYSCKSLINTC